MSFMNRILVCLSIAAVLICYSCGENKTENQQPAPKEEIALFTPYEQMPNARIYLNKAFNSDSIPSDTLFFIPLNSCDKCIQLILNSLLENEFSGTIIFGGNIRNKPVFEKQYNTLMLRSFCLVDENYLMYKYDLDIYGPTLLIRNNQSPLIAHLDFNNWKDVLKELQWK
ncbi:hypothetical protein D3C71_595750 [compost metagenome]